MAILIDTQVIAWMRTGDARLGRTAEQAIVAGDQSILGSAVTAHEFADLDRRGRFGPPLNLETVVEALAATVVDFPAACWKIAADLPLLHLDPVDRMLVAHAIHADLTLVTADATMRSYPVRTLW